MNRFLIILCRLFAYIFGLFSWYYVATLAGLRVTKAGFGVTNTALSESEGALWLTIGSLVGASCFIHLGGKRLAEEGKRLAEDLDSATGHLFPFETFQNLLALLFYIEALILLLGLIMIFSLPVLRCIELFRGEFYPFTLLGYARVFWVLSLVLSIFHHGLIDWRGLVKEMISR
jgi:hypothetical protein